MNLTVIYSQSAPVSDVLRFAVCLRNDSNCVYVFQDPRLDKSEEKNDVQSKLEKDTSEEKETIVEKGDTDFKEIETEPKMKVKYDSDFLIEGDLEEMMPNSDDYYDDYTAYTTPETTRLVQINAFILYLKK